MYEWHDFKQEHQTGDKIAGEFTISPCKADSKRIDFEILGSDSLRKPDFKHSRLLGRLQKDTWNL